MHLLTIRYVYVPRNMSNQRKLVSFVKLEERECEILHHDYGNCAFKLTTMTQNVAMHWLMIRFFFFFDHFFHDQN